MLASGESFGQSVVVAASAVLADVWPDSQKTGNAAWHAMRSSDQSLQQGIDAYLTFLDERLNGGMPWDLGRALHATEDSVAAAHGFNVWDGDLTLAHVLLDLFPSPEELWRALQRDYEEIQRWKKRCRK
jgi:hypothetical protein